MDENYPTGTVEVTLDNKGIPSYIIHENVAWDYIKRTESCVELAKKADAICFGSLGQRSESSRNTILSMLENANDSSNDKCLKIFDINLRQHFYNKEIIHTSLKYANVLKLNDEELPIVAKLLGLEDKSESNNKEKAVNMIESHNTADEHENNKIYILNALADIYSLDLIALTCGKKGSLLLSKGRTSSHPGFKVKIVDTVGAGDAFTAAVTIGLLQGFDLDEINNLANKLASYVCSQEGGTPSLPKELTGLFE